MAQQLDGKYVLVNAPPSSHGRLQFDGYAMTVTSVTGSFGAASGCSTTRKGTFVATANNSNAATLHFTSKTEVDGDRHQQDDAFNQNVQLTVNDDGTLSFEGGVYEYKYDDPSASGWGTSSKYGRR